MTEHQVREGVRVVDVDMPFLSMVKFMVKWAIASIPALVFLMIIGGLVGGAIAGVSTGILSSLNSGSITKEREASALPHPSAPTSPTPPEAAAPQWELTRSSNPLDDSPMVVLSLDAASPSRMMLGGAPTLLLRCKSKRIEAFINWSAFLGTDEVQVTTRIGREQATARGWSLSSDNKASFYPGNVGEFIKRLMSADTLVAVTTPYGESPVTAIFEIKGLNSKIQPLRDACSLKL